MYAPRQWNGNSFSEPSLARSHKGKMHRHQLSNAEWGPARDAGSTPLATRWRQRAISQVLRNRQRKRTINPIQRQRPFDHFSSSPRERAQRETKYCVRQTYLTLPCLSLVSWNALKTLKWRRRYVATQVHDQSRDHRSLKLAWTWGSRLCRKLQKWIRNTIKLCGNSEQRFETLFQSD